jgi:tRNA-guanine family transglycosylase
VSKTQLQTRHGTITFPTFMPVTTFGGKYPLDDLVRPYLGRFAQCLMISYHYAEQMKERPDLPLFIDSGGFASLFEGAEIIDQENFASIKTKEGDSISPPEVLAFQERHADIGATLDFITPPNLDLKEAKYRQELTVKNAIWAIENRTNSNLKLFASIQAWDEDSAYRIMNQLIDYPFDGFALGGMVPRIKHPERVISIVKAIHKINNNRPLHVFGIGQPNLMRDLFANGVASTDSSSFLKGTADKKYLNPKTLNWNPLVNEGETDICCNCISCNTYSLDYFMLPGETNNLALAIHNLHILNNF